jgi:hypothetical protein
MGTRKHTPRKGRQEAQVIAGPLRNSHKISLKKIWDERPCLPSVASRRAWARARGIDPSPVNKWFYAQVKKARESGLELDTENEGYNLDLEDGNPIQSLITSTPGRDPNPHSTTPEGLPELSCYEHSTASETGLRILLSPGQSSSPIFGSSFYSPKLTLDTPTDAYGRLVGIKRFIFTPPSSPGCRRTICPRTPSQHPVEELQTDTHRRTPSLPVSPIPNGRFPPLPLAPKKSRPPRDSHDILDFRVLDPCLRLPSLSPTPTQSGYSVPYNIGPQIQEEGDKQNVSTLADLPMITVKTSRLSKQQQGGCINDNQPLSRADNHTTTPLYKFPRTIAISYTITLKVRPFQLSVSGPLSKCP